MTDVIELPLRLEMRRKSIQMTKKRLAQRAGMSLPTVNRILSGREKRLTIGSIQSLARVLGVVIRFGASVGFDEVETAFAFRERQAAAKAKRLVGMIQATMGLEAQAVGDDVVDQMVKQTTCELLAGSPQRLWAD
jgi:transcriptional regulator with XRE-family HTH domain